MWLVFLWVDDNDMIFFYFFGYGLQGVFLLVDYNGFDNRLEYEEICSIFWQSCVKYKLVLVDVCYVGSLFVSWGLVYIVLQEYYQVFNESSGGMVLLFFFKGEEYLLEDCGL